MPGRPWNRHYAGPWAPSDAGRFSQSTSMQMPGQGKPGLSISESDSKVKDKKRNKITKQEAPLAPPPGLEGFVGASLAPQKPVGLVKPAQDACQEIDADILESFQAMPGSFPPVQVDTVEVTGLPNKLLSHDMLEAVLEQAGILYAVAHFKCFAGKQCGRAWIYFNKGNDAAMEACVSHFHGCMWDTTTKVSARVTCSRDSCAKGNSMHNLAMPKRSGREKAMPASNFMQEHPPALTEYMSASAPTGLKSVEATPWFKSNEPAYVGPAYVHSSLLSGATGPTNRMADVKKAGKKGAAPKNGVNTMTERNAPGRLADRHRGTSSDASTAVSDSETEGEEKACASKVFASL